MEMSSSEIVRFEEENENLHEAEGASLKGIGETEVCRVELVWLSGKHHVSM